jgi:heme-degrading monooxygenase HmoA
MIVRIWQVGIASGKEDELEVFANTISLPMFQTQPGCLGVLFTKTQAVCTTVTFWESEESIEKLNSSESYNSVVSKIERSGILEGQHKTESFECYGGFLDRELIHALSCQGL